MKERGHFYYFSANFIFLRGYEKKHSSWRINSSFMTFYERLISRLALSTVLRPKFVLPHLGEGPPIDGHHMCAMIDSYCPAYISIRYCIKYEMSIPEVRLDHFAIFDLKYIHTPSSWDDSREGERTRKRQLIKRRKCTGKGFIDDVVHDNYQSRFNYNVDIRGKRREKRDENQFGGN